MGSLSLTFRLSIRISPSVTFSNPAIIRNKVDFPHPDGPTITMNSPSSTSKSMPCMTLTLPKDFLTFFRIKPDIVSFVAIG